MNEKRLAVARRFMHNMVVHVKRVVLRLERPVEALHGVRSDARKLQSSWSAKESSGDHGKARRYLEKGRKAYNVKDFSEAEEYFRKAIASDHLYAWAHTYLGHTLYKLGRQPEAVDSWRKAVAADPGSDAAEKAASKLRRIDNQAKQALKQMEEEF